VDAPRACASTVNGEYLASPSNTNAVVALAMPTSVGRWPTWALCVTAILSLSGGGSAEGEDPPLRMIIAANVVCRAEPSRAAPMVHRYHVGDLLSADPKETPKYGDAWYLDHRWIETFSIRFERA
jgi:hypothetical protein